MLCMASYYNIPYLSPMVIIRTEFMNTGPKLWIIHVIDFWPMYETALSNQWNMLRTEFTKPRHVPPLLNRIRYHIRRCFFSYLVSWVSSVVNCELHFHSCGGQVFQLFCFSVTLQATIWPAAARRYSFVSACEFHAWWNIATFKNTLTLSHVWENAAPLAIWA